MGTPEAIFCRRLKEAREARRMSQRRLVARLAELGHPMNQSAITRIERGERKVSLDESIVLAVALDVAPVHLFLPIGNSGRITLTPKVKKAAVVARQWALGLRPLDPANTRFYASQSPAVPDWDEIQVQRQEDEQTILAERDLMEQEGINRPQLPRAGK